MIPTKDKITLTVNCQHCGKEHKLRVNYDDYAAWRNGEKLIQEAFPYLTPEKRELLLSGLCPFCWDEMFGQY